MTTQQRQPLKILLIGDLCLDIYEYGTVTRLSPEAPVPVFQTKEQYQAAGMAGNVKNNLDALGCFVEGVFAPGQLSKKTRYIDIHSNQHIVRVDSDVKATPITSYHFPSKWETKFDAVVISDYNKGAVAPDLIENVRRACDLPIFVDTKLNDLQRLEGCIVKINEAEYGRLTSECSDLIVTMGSKGARYKGVVYPTPSIDITDVCGAGDTFLAALAYKFLLTRDLTQAIPFANKASSVTVQHMGVYAPSLEEIERVN